MTNINNGFKDHFLLPATNSGILDGLTFSVKDTFDVKGYKTSFGNPLWEKTHPIATENAICVQQLLANGASCLGTTIIGELGCGSAGVNYFFGTPQNPKAPEFVPGGSSSGAATSVASGLVDFSLATDAGGSIRVPASFCGLIGMRPSHGMISTSGMISLNPSFDTVGILTSSMDTLSKTMSVLVGSSWDENKIGKIFIIEDLVKICDNNIRDAMEQFYEICNEEFNQRPITISFKEIDGNAVHPNLGIADTFLNILCGETWTSISSWASEVGLEFGKNTYVDFSFMQRLEKDKISKAFLKKEFFCEKINNLLSPNNLICIPTTPFSTFKKSQHKTKINDFDYERLRPLVSLASIGRLPQINLPIINKYSLPIGISLIAGYKKDHYLIEIAKRIHRLL